MVRFKIYKMNLMQKMARKLNQTDRIKNHKKTDLTFIRHMSIPLRSSTQHDNASPLARVLSAPVSDQTDRNLESFPARPALP